jgi:class 3 adenylate cyclase
MPEERKLVTLLFADVTGSTALGDSTDPEDVRALMGRYYAHARRIISAHGGTIEKFIGDAVMAVFGLTQAHGDDPERALAAALALREAVATDTLLGSVFQLRIGVNTGEVVATSDLSSGDFLVTGDAVNVAARLQQTCSPGEIVASERTASAAQSSFLFDESRQVEVKGKRQPLTVFPLKGPRPVRQVERPPLVGRKQDLLQLSLLLARVQEEQRPQLVSIIAPAGTGKTRLLEEFLSRLDPADGFQVATARCLPYGQTLTYWPLRGLLTGLLGGDVARAQVEDTFLKGGYKPEDAARLADLVLATLGIEGEGTGDRESIFAAWRLLIEVISRQAPRIIVFEDLHWASDSLLDLVEQIMHLRAHAPLLLIALSRPELMDRRPTWGGGRQNFTSLALQPLTAAQTRQLVDHLVADAPEATRSQIVERSGGNPFFALELAHGLAEQRQAGETSRLKTLPDTIHAAVQARMDLLTPAERAVLLVASVASRAFRAEMLQAVLADNTRQELDTALDGLLARDMIVPAEGSAFTFRHILIRDVAYGTLSRAERVRLHARIAAWFEETAADRLDEFTELIAYHYREALMLSRQSVAPLEAPVEPERAIRFLRRAGHLASRAGAFAEARSHLQSAIDLAPEREYVSLYEELGDSVLWGEIGLQAYRKALEYWRSSGAADPLTGARLIRKILIGSTRYFVATGLEPGELETLQAEAHRQAEAAGDADERWHVLVADLFLAKAAKAEISVEALNQLRSDGLAAAAYFEAQENWEAFSEALDGYSVVSLKMRAFDDTYTAVTRRLSAPHLPPHERADALGMLAALYLRQSDYESCIAAVREPLARLRPGDSIVPFMTVIPLAAEAALISGQWSELSQFAPILAQIWEQVQYDQSTARVITDGYFALLTLALAREDRAATDAAFSVITRLFQGAPDHQLERMQAYRAGDIQKLLDLALAHPEESNGIIELIAANEHGLVAPDALIERVLDQPWAFEMAAHYAAIARALAAGDDTRLAAAVDDAEAHHMIPHAARMRIVLAQRTGDRSQLARARPVLERLEDRLFLRRLAEVEAALPS